MMHASSKRNGSTYYYYQRLLRIVYPKGKAELMNVSRNYLVFVDWDDRSVTREPMSGLLQDMNEDDLRRLALKTIPEEELGRIYSLLSAGPFEMDRSLAHVFRPKEDGEPLPEMGADERMRMIRQKTKPSTASKVPRIALASSPDYARDHKRHLATQERPEGAFERGELPEYHQRVTPFGFKMDKVLLWRDRDDHEVVQTLVPLMEMRDLESPSYYALSPTGRVLHNTLTAADHKWEPNWSESMRAIPISNLSCGNANHSELRKTLQQLKIDYVSFVHAEGADPLLVQIGGKLLLRVNEELYYNLLTRSPAAISTLKGMGVSDALAESVGPLEATLWVRTKPVPSGGRIEPAPNGGQIEPDALRLRRPPVESPSPSSSGGYGQRFDGHSPDAGPASGGYGSPDAGTASGGYGQRLDGTASGGYGQRFDGPASGGYGSPNAFIGGAFIRPDSDDRSSGGPSPVKRARLWGSRMKLFERLANNVRELNRIRGKAFRTPLDEAAQRDLQDGNEQILEQLGVGR